MSRRALHKVVMPSMHCLLALISSGCGAVTSPEQPTIAAIEQLGGNVRRDKGFVVKVDLHNSRATDADLAMLAKLEHLDRLYLPPAITDAGMTSLASLKELTRLDLQYTQVTDAGLAQLQALPKLAQVYTNGSKVTDAGIKQLQQLRPQMTIEQVPIDRSY